VATLASVWARVLVPAVAREFLEVFGNYVTVEFGVEAGHLGTVRACWRKGGTTLILSAM
jgi:hypothetical protein